MNRKIFLPATCMVALLCFSACKTQQISSWEGFKSRYADAGTSLRLNGPLFKLGMKIASVSADDPEAEDILHRLRKFRGVELHVIPIHKVGLSYEDVRNLDNLLLKDHYASLVNIRHEKDLVRIWAKGKEDEFKDPLVLINNEDDLVMIELRGSLTADDIGALADAGRDIQLHQK
jgi:hypothetical protein